MSSMNSEHRPPARHWLSPASFLGAFLLVLSACANHPKSPVIGKWVDPVKKDTMEFRSDGTLQGVDGYGRPLTGTFKLLEANHVQITMTSSSVDKRTGVKVVDNAAGVCRFDVNGTSLTLTEADGTATHFQRAN